MEIKIEIFVLCQLAVVHFQVGLLEKPAEIKFHFHNKREMKHFFVLLIILLLSVLKH